VQRVCVCAVDFLSADRLNQSINIVACCHIVKLCPFAARASWSQHQKYSSFHLSFTCPIHENDQRWTHRRSSWVEAKGPRSPSKFLENIVVFCFERRFSNTIVLLFFCCYKVNVICGAITSPRGLRLITLVEIWISIRFGFRICIIFCIIVFGWIWIWKTWLTLLVSGKDSKVTAHCHDHGMQMLHETTIRCQCIAPCWPLGEKQSLRSTSVIDGTPDS